MTAKMAIPIEEKEQRIDHAMVQNFPIRIMGR